MDRVTDRGSESHPAAVPGVDLGAGDGAVRRSVLPHGLRLVTERMDHSQSVALGVYAPVGSRHESAVLHGASHFLEHLLFKGTERRTAEQISAAVESVGGDLNAYTAKEHTCFYARVLPEHASLAIQVLVDMLGGSLIRPADLESERAVILDEIAMHDDDPAERVAELTTTALLGPVGLGRAVIGSAQSIRAMKRGRVVRHWRRHYRPSQLVVAAAGALDHDALLGELGSLDELPTPDASAVAAVDESTPQPERVASGGPRVVFEPIQLAQTTAMLAYRTDGIFDSRRYPLGLLALIVGGGMASRLFVEVRERRGLTYGIDAGESSYSDAGLWSVDWHCAPDRLAPIVGLVWSTLQDVANQGVTAEELARAKGQMRGQTVLAYESPSSRMGRLGVNTVLGDERSLVDVLNGFDAVSGEEVRAAAASLFSAPPVLGVVGPNPPDDRVVRLLS